MRGVLLLLLAGCSDYGLKVHDQVEGGTETDSGGHETGETGETTGDSGDTGRTDSGGAIDSGEPDTDTRPCADDPDPATWQWWGSQPFDDEADPTDSAGRAWYATDYDMVGWSTVALPDSGHCPAGDDRLYRAWFHVTDTDHRITFRLQSDDGVWLYVNGTLAGHWGGDWQEEGCVNDDADCEVATTVAPVNLTDLLVAGDNLIAARVSNAVDTQYFDLQWECSD